MDFLKEATDIYARLAKEEPAAHNEKLASGLANLSGVMNHLQMYPEAVETLERSNQVYGRMAKAQPYRVGQQMAYNLYC